MIILVGHKGEKIKQYFGDGSKFGVRITYVEEKKPLGTANPLHMVKDFIGKDPFIMYYGDVLAEIDLHELVDYHFEHKGLATLSLSPVEDPSAFGLVRLRGSRVISIDEKPKKTDSSSRLVNAGIHVLDPKIIDYVPKKGFSMLEKDVFPRLAKEQKIYGYPFEGKWFDVSTPEIYERAVKKWKK